ncbi:hypothetical protein KC326_g220 [Hortaea werneckii]|nr:hypothetical protein KC326_g220 [Hortaea werneckii]
MLIDHHLLQRRGLTNTAGSPLGLPDYLRQSRTDMGQVVESVDVVVILLGGGASGECLNDGGEEKKIKVGYSRNGDCGGGEGGAGGFQIIKNEVSSKKKSESTQRCVWLRLPRHDAMRCDAMRCRAWSPNPSGWNLPPTFPSALTPRDDGWLPSSLGHELLAAVYSIPLFLFKKRKFTFLHKERKEGSKQANKPFIQAKSQMKYSPAKPLYQVSNLVPSDLGSLLPAIRQEKKNEQASNN